MSVYLLLIFPIFAVSALVFFVVRKHETLFQKKDNDLSAQVTFFNERQPDKPFIKPLQSDRRILEIEKKMVTVEEALTHQKNTIDKFYESTTNVSESEQLKSKLKALYKEYDLLASENYSLRAKLGKMINRPAAPVLVQSSVAAGTMTMGTSTHADAPSLQKKHSTININLYEDTCLIEFDSVDDLVSSNYPATSQPN